MSDPAAIDDLARFLRASGCVAVLRGATRLEASPKVSLGETDEQAQLDSLVRIWCAEHPGVDVKPA